MTMNIAVIWRLRIDSINALLQAIIVANDEAKASIPPQLKQCSILTVFESKGLEFDDVLIFNFFKNSEVGCVRISSGC